MLKLMIFILFWSNGPIHSNRCKKPLNIRNGEWGFVRTADSNGWRGTLGGTQRPIRRGNIGQWEKKNKRKAMLKCMIWEKKKNNRESSGYACVVRRSDEWDGTQSQVRIDSSLLNNTKQAIHIKLVWKLLNFRYGIELWLLAFYDYCLDGQIVQTCLSALEPTTWTVWITLLISCFTQTPFSFSY